MDELIINSEIHQYKIIIGNRIRYDINALLPKPYSTILVITDDKVAEKYLNEVMSNLQAENIFTSIIPAGEQSKSFALFEKLHTEALTYGLDRESLIIALGGGVVGDLAGFVAATYMRGIDYIQMPTTILAHDSSVGGKVAINHQLGKNLIGSFYPPKAVLYDIDTLSTLPRSQVRSGYAELIKEGLIADEELFQSILSSDLMSLSQDQLHNHIRSGIKIKAAIVEADEKEKGMRKYLNLGHTLGHALETTLGYGVLTHGEAIGIGLLFSMYVSESVYTIKLPYEPLYRWLLNNNYPLFLEQLHVNDLITLMKTDKKTLNHHIQMVLLKNVGEPVIKEISDEDMSSYLKQFLRKLVIA